MIRRLVAMALAAGLFASPLNAIAQVQNIKFGILQLMPDGGYKMDVETTRIPRRLKDTGFRFGIAFDNPRGETIEFREVMHLPAEMQQTSGDLHRIDPKLLQTDMERTDSTQWVDQFWFDQGDPLGKHRLELYVNGTRKFSVDFEVVEP